MREIRTLSFFHLSCFDSQEPFCLALFRKKDHKLISRLQTLDKVLRLRVVLGRLCTGKCKLLDSFEQALEMKCPKLVRKYQNDSKAEVTCCPSETESDSDSAEGTEGEDKVSASSVIY